MAQGVSWVEGRPETARLFKNWPHRQWVEFVLGIRTFWPSPANARRVCSVWPVTKEGLSTWGAQGIARAHEHLARQRERWGA